MSLTRRDAIALSGSTLAGVSLGLVGAEQLVGQTPPAGQQTPPFPETLTEMPRREGFPTPLPVRSRRGIDPSGAPPTAPRR